MPWTSAAGETAEAWDACVGELSAKGITEETTPWAVSDGAKGLACEQREAVVASLQVLNRTT